MFKTILSVVGLLLLLIKSEGQTACTTLGQNPLTAFPVCGTSVFQQSTVPICGDRTLSAPGCSGVQLSDKNPFWYKFTCFTGGSLGFLITPLDLNEDYDWQLFDVTNRNPDDVFSDPSLFVACNWSGEKGLTGSSSAGTSLVVCATINGQPYRPLFSSMPTLIQGHEYLLLISHFSDSQSGYELSFGGGTASITDPKEPHLQSARAICDGIQGAIKFNKRMKCSSLTLTGTEFTLFPPLANVISATGFGCAGGFDMDSLIFTLDTPLPPGQYDIIIGNGDDGNTIKDNCDRFIPSGEKIQMIVYPVVPTPMDSMSRLFCSPDELQLVFRKNMRCSSIASDGSDFRVNLISGTTPVTVTGASGNCSADGLTQVIKVKLSAPIQTRGTYQLQLVTGTDGNTIIDECGQETPAGATLNFNTKDTVNADFTYNIKIGCIRDTIDYFHDGRNEVNVWKWNFDNNRKSGLQNPSIIYASFGQKQTQLIVSNGVCTDTSDIVPIFLDNAMNAAFEATGIVCPGDLATFKDISTGNIVSWNWDFGNGNTSSLQAPPSQSYLPPPVTSNIFPRLIIENNYGCFDTAIQKILVPNNCYIAVPGAFSPNKDGLNDYLYPINAYKAADLLFRVYNRFGQLIFETRDWTKKWDGTFKGQGVDPATYVWILHYTDSDTGKRVEQKGTTILLR